MIESAPYIVLLVAIWAIYGGLKGRHASESSIS